MARTAKTTDGAPSRAEIRRQRGERLSTPRARLTTPLMRVNGVLEPTTWDVALDRVAGDFTRIRDHHGSDAFAMFSCSKSTNEMNYAAQKFSRVALGSNNIDSCNRT